MKFVTEPLFLLHKPVRETGYDVNSPLSRQDLSSMLEEHFQSSVVSTHTLYLLKQGCCAHFCPLAMPAIEKTAILSPSKMLKLASEKHFISLQRVVESLKMLGRKGEQLYLCLFHLLNCHDLAKQLSHYLYFFSFSFLFLLDLQL